MRAAKKIWKTCSRGHRFQKSSDCPVCPVCWSGYYRKKSQRDFPDKISAPALRALLNAKILSLAQLAKHSERDIATLHGMGPAGVKILRVALQAKGKSFKASSPKKIPKK